MALVLVKCGGAASELDPEATILPLVAAGDRVVVVHGAGPQISQEMERRGLPVEFRAGRRVTTPEALEVVRESLAQVNASLVAALAPTAVPLWGDEIGLRARQVEGLGLVGDPEPSRPQAVLDALAAGALPVVAPLAEGPLNVNADEMAVALAIGLGADRIVFYTDVPGVFVDGEVADELDADWAEQRIADGVFQGGIVPKLRAAGAAARHGIEAGIGRTRVTSKEAGS